MQHEWKQRLLDAITNDGRSGRALAKKLKLGPNAISELRKTEKTPSFDKVMSLIDELGVSRSYIILGVDIGPKEEALLQTLKGIGPGAVDNALALLQARLASNQPETRPAHPGEAGETGE